MANPLLVAGGIKLGSGILGKLIGGKPKTEAAVPEDLKGMRAQQIGLLNFLLGMGPDPRMTAGANDPKRQELARLAGQKGLLGKAATKALGAFNTQNPTTPQMMPGMSVYQPPVQPNQPMFRPGVAGGPLVRMMAGGGMVEGPGGPTDDMVPALLSNGEGVLNTAAVEEMGGPEIIHLLNMLGMLKGGQFQGMSPYGDKSKPLGPQPMNTGGIAGQKNTQPILPGMGPMPGVPDTPAVMPQAPGMVNYMAPQTPTAPAPNINMANTGQPAPGGAGQAMTPQQRLESFFGPLGINQSNLQQAATAGWMGQLTNVSPEQRAAEITLPQLQQNLSGSPVTQDATNRMMGINTGAGADVEGRLGQIGQRPITGSSGMDAVLQQLGMGGQGGINFNGSGLGIPELQRLAGQNPGEGVMAALNPVFQRNLAAANQQGGRFGTANAVLRSRAVDDFNLQSANALQRGVDQQIAAAQGLGSVGNAQDDLRLRGLLGGQQGQLEALRLGITGAQGLDDSALRALGTLGGFRQQGAQLEGNILGNAGQLGIAQGQLGNQTSDLIAQILGRQGQAGRETLTGAFNAGAANTGMENVGQQRTIDLLLQQLGVSQGATLGGPATQTPGLGQDVAQMGSELGNLYYQNAMMPRTGG